MFARISTLFVFTLPLLAAAGAIPREEPTEAGKAPETPEKTPEKTPDVYQCNTGPVQCCNSVQSASEMTSILNLLGLVKDIDEDPSDDTMVGVTCSPQSGDNTCTAQTVCCNNNNFNGLVAIGCSPINIYL